MKAYYVSNNEEILYVCISAELAESKKERELEDNDNDCEK